MAHIQTHAWRVESGERPLQSLTARELGPEVGFSEDDFDYPPTLHPGRELFTFSLFALMIMSLGIWGGWKLISLAISSL
jgi:hypothetical protein